MTRVTPRRVSRRRAAGRCVAPSTTRRHATATPRDPSSRARAHRTSIAVCARSRRQRGGKTRAPTESRTTTNETQRTRDVASGQQEEDSESATAHRRRRRRRRKQRPPPRRMLTDLLMTDLLTTDPLAARPRPHTTPASRRRRFFARAPLARSTAGTCNAPGAPAARVPRRSGYDGAPPLPRSSRRRQRSARPCRRPAIHASSCGPPTRSEVLSSSHARIWWAAGCDGALKAERPPAEITPRRERRP